MDQMVKSTKKIQMDSSQMIVGDLSLSPFNQTKVIKHMEEASSHQSAHFGGLSQKKMNAPKEQIEMLISENNIGLNSFNHESKLQR